MKKQIEVFRDVENSGSFLVYNAKDKKEALLTLEFEYPEVKGEFKIKDIKDTFSYKCLDCLSYWISEDVCGECGEDRLSKKAIQVFYFIK